MGATSVTSKGQVTIPREVRQRLGIRQGSRIEFLLRGGRVELRVERPPAPVVSSGFGLLKSRRKAVAVDLDPATLVKTRKQPRSASTPISSHAIALKTQAKTKAVGRPGGSVRRRGV